MDERLVRPTGIPFAAVRAAPLRVGSPIDAVRNIFVLLLGTFQALLLLRRFRPDVVFATGGYASVPAGLATRFRRTPLVVFLPDVKPGWAVRLLVRLATRVATSTDVALRHLPRHKSSVVGYPVRDEFWSADRHQARSSLGIPEDALVLLVWGGSQGARSINSAVVEQLRELLGACQILHVTGQAEEGRALSARDELPLDDQRRYHVFAFVDAMADLMTASDLGVMRSGASVIGEVPAAGLATVLVPGVYAAGHDQIENARFLEAEGAAVVLEEHQLAELATLVGELFRNQEKRRKMSAAARGLARPEAARSLAAVVEGLAA
jgi:UDP-N-acetylglucosamine--N-acetylmuramyl-(pentapeptide) pyrophosphoryl-undecaprenol N-acetylglucosamine transferase